MSKIKKSYDIKRFHTTENDDIYRFNVSNFEEISNNFSAQRICKVVQTDNEKITPDYVNFFFK